MKKPRIYFEETTKQEVMINKEEERMKRDETTNKEEDTTIREEMLNKEEERIKRQETTNKEEETTKQE